MSAPRPVLYDLTHLSHRADIAAPSGIDRVDLMFAQRFACSPRLAGAVHYGLRRPSLLNPIELAAVVARAERRWSGAAADDPAFVRLRAWLLGQKTLKSAMQRRETPAWRQELVRRTRIGRYKLISGSRAVDGAVYLNVAQHALERTSHFAWLLARRDVAPVFFLHDLLPLDYPEFWPAGHETLFADRIKTLFALARGIVTSTQTVAERIREEYRRRKSSVPPLLALPLPSPLQTRPPTVATRDLEIAETPYFVIVGTVEPRKNHLALLNLWRAMIERGDRPPKLVIVGARGWVNAETTALLDRCLALRNFVSEAAGLTDNALKIVLSHARAVLAPSFSEGYGLPVVEALQLGTPVVASDLPVFREVTKGNAILIDLANGLEWRETVLALADSQSAVAVQAKCKSLAFEQQQAEHYFSCVDDFLQAI